MTRKTALTLYSPIFTDLRPLVCFVLQRTLKGWFSDAPLVMNDMGSPNSNGCNLALPPDDVIFGHSEVMRPLQQMVERLAGVQLPVLIYGETGTGKEVLANYIHRRSPRKDRPFVKISCAAIPASLLEAELLGYEQGAFTGAYWTKPGLVESADSGTLLLDDIAELDVTIQAKLLQLLQEGTFTHIGGQDELRIDARVICVANRNLRDDIAQGRFRLDLFHRINGASFRVPDLRERVEDIPAIAAYLIERFNKMFHTHAWPLSPAICRRLQQYRW